MRNNGKVTAFVVSLLATACADTAGSESNSAYYLKAQGADVAPCALGANAFAMTDTSKTFIRQGNGEYGAPRLSGGAHTGVDIIVNATHRDNASYAVRPIAPGTVAYSRLNGTQTTGFGNVIVVDHGSGCYSMYAHLANLPFTPIQPGGNLLRQVGDRVTPTDTIGYMVDIVADVDSSGNAQSTAPEARHQVHFELIEAPSGRRSMTSLAAIISPAGSRIDPTPTLRSLGYRVR